MTSSMANTLRTRFNSLRVSFFKKRLHLSVKREGSGWRQQRTGRSVFLKIKEKSGKKSNQ